MPILGSEEDRQHRKNQQLIRQKQMIELCRTTGQKLLFEGKYESAVPAALAALKFAIQVYGLSSIELVPSYLILGEASIGLNKLSQANEYLSQAQWTVLKTPECGNEIKSRLYRNLGLLEAARKNYFDALSHLSNDVYHSSCAYGTDDIQTSGGYFHMANVFYRQNRLDVAFSLYNQVIDIWNGHLSHLVDQRTREPEVTTGLIGQMISGDNANDIDVLGEAQEAEAIQVLNAVLELREQQTVQNASIMCKVYYTLTMLHFILNDSKQAEEFAGKAKTACENIVSGDAGMAEKISELSKAIEQIETPTS
ncbi:zinc finger MYND domain-containing 12-like [Paramuricea clavata]|uniref:Zinc finger MYND domain-containing 12-like n=1 Tax=Paramuricea clavata TaxID=317549 RepID=A0A6S7JRB6_PARCT|nr:zinc finger MYND domain-containing 12-like [Paramuricea clavata]